MFSLVRRHGAREATLFRSETEAECRQELNKTVFTLDDGESILLLKTARGTELHVLGTYIRPPKVSSASTKKAHGEENVSDGI